jgi:MFS family permease
MVSLTGDQFYLLALPWLVLQTTHSPLAVGLVTAVTAVPRAAFMLLAGSLTDHLSPRLLMLTSNLVRMVLVACLAGLTMVGWADLWMLCLFGLAFGTGDALYHPARGALVPRILPSRSLAVGNATLQATNQMALFLGPLLAGYLIAALFNSRGGNGSAYEWAVGVALAVDAATFLTSAVLLALMRSEARVRSRSTGLTRQALWTSTLEGLRSARRDRFLRTTFLLIGAGNFFITGPLYISLPVLADTRYAGGASALGLVLALFGAGSLLGLALGGLANAPTERFFPLIMGVCPAAMGAGLVALGVVPSAGSAAAVAAFMGLAQGYVVVQFVTLLHKRTPPQMLGRVMSLLMFLVVGLAPVSSGVAGALIEFSVTYMLIGAGTALIAVVLAAFALPALRPFTGFSSGSTTMQPRSEEESQPRFAET